MTTDAPLQAIVDAAPKYRGGPRRFELVPFKHIRLNRHQRRYLVKHILPRQGLALVWGPPKCGKSFWIYDLLMHVARGVVYRDFRVQQAPVVYIALEGGEGLSARAEAYRRTLASSDDDPPFHQIIARLDLIAERSVLIDEVRDQLGAEVPGAICIDTLNRSLKGSESNDEDMGDYVKAADALREAFECLVVIVHHCGIDGNRP